MQQQGATAAFRNLAKHPHGTAHKAALYDRLLTNPQQLPITYPQQLPRCHVADNLPFCCCLCLVASAVGASFVQVPYRLLKNFHKIQQRLVRELEKKFSGKDVVVVANRRIMPPPTSGKSNARPRSRTLTAVR
jgi:hypothetical protein